VRGNTSISGGIREVGRAEWRRITQPHAVRKPELTHRDSSSVGERTRMSPLWQRPEMLGERRTLLGGYDYTQMAIQRGVHGYLVSRIVR
jgi:hypothetical protein